jgi:hypothetical protein
MIPPSQTQSISLLGRPFTCHPFGAKGFFLLWLATFSVCILGNGLAGRWLSTAAGLDFDAESTRTAAAILKYGEFRDPFAPMPTGPSSHVAPAYPVLFSAVVATFGSGKPGWWAIRLISLAAYSLQLSLLPLLGVELGFSPLVGLIAAGLGCLVPLPGSCYKWEALFTGLLLVAIAYTLLRLRRSKALSTAAALGVLTGVALLFSPVLAMVCIAWVLLIWRSLNLKLLLLMAGLSLLIISPWLVRNYRVFGAFIFIRDDLGTELAVSNNDCASAWSLDNIRTECFALTHPNANLKLDQRIVDLGEHRFNAEELSLAWSWISGHWRQFGALSAQRFVFFWFPAAAGGPGLALLGALYVSVLTAASIPGLLLMYRENRFATYMLGECIVLYPLVHYLVHVDVRYRYPILWVSTMATAYLWARPRKAVSS